MASKNTPYSKGRVKFKKADFEKFAKKMDEWSNSLPPKERALLIALLAKGSSGIKEASDDVVQTTIMTSVDAKEFDLVQFIVKVILAIKGIEAVVEEDGPSWIQEDWRR